MLTRDYFLWVYGRSRDNSQVSTRETGGNYVPHCVYLSFLSLTHSLARTEATKTPLKTAFQSRCTVVGPQKVPVASY